MYGGAWGEKKLGNTQPGDALAFKGRGFIGLTGRANYTAAAEATGLDLVNHPELASDPQNAAKIATWYWKSRSGLSDAAKAGDVVTASAKINGGTNGLQDRKDKFKAYLAESSPAKTADVAASATPMTLASAAPGASVRPPTPPAAVPAVAPPPPPPAVEIPIPMDSKPAIAVTVASEKLAGQDLKDRQLARIATGGLG
jgi:putative chitinase